MTRKQKEKDLDKKVREFINESAKHMRKNIARAINSGALDINSHDADDWLMPRVIFQALLMEEQHQYKFHADEKKRKKEIENVYYSM